MLKLAVEGFESIVPVAICDNDPGALQKAEEAYPDTKRFEDFDAMLESADMDALLVETPAHLHAEFCSKALLKNVHVMGDVPCVDSLEEAVQLWKAQEKSTAFYMFGENNNPTAYMDAAVNLKKRGLLGDPYYIEAEYIHDLRHLEDVTPWRRSYEPIRYCTHSLGPVLRLIEEDLEWVSCFDTGSHFNHAPDEHDAMAALMRTPSNVVIRVLTAFRTHYPGCAHHYRVHATKGYFERSPAYDGPGSERTFFISEDIDCDTPRPCDKRLIEFPTGRIPARYARNPVARAGGTAGRISPFGTCSSMPSAAVALRRSISATPCA